MADSAPNTDTPQPTAIRRDQLPFACPPAGTDPAALHPRVYIPLKKGGETLSCPYCGALYYLAD